jgi:hypothetical protein
MSTELKQVNKLKKTSRRNENLNDTQFVERLIKISRVTKVTKDSNKLSIRKFATKRVRIIAFALIPTLLIGGTARALEPTNGVLTFEQCMAMVESTRAVDTATKSSVVLETFRKLSGYGVNGYVCKTAYDESKKQTQKAKTPLEVAFWSALMLACGAALALHAEGVLNK